MDAADRMKLLTVPASAAAALDSFDQPIRHWFTKTFGEPTLPQRFGWPAILRGENLLLGAPTGTGKTLAAFLPILGDLWRSPGNDIQCLYIAPLKALCRDAYKNLRRHCRDIGGEAACFARGRDSSRHTPCAVRRRRDTECAYYFVVARGQVEGDARLHRLRIGLRTGDTSPRERRHLRERPPHILLTTPESLAIMLTHAPTCELFRNLRWVVVDELHALAQNKRGADLALSLERIDALVGQTFLSAEAGKNACPTSKTPQRIGLSATCAPVETAARFLVGVGRPCTIAQVNDTAPVEIAIEPLPECGGGFMARLIARLHREFRRNRTTLLFTNLRSLAEQLTWALKRRYPKLKRKIAVHHSSLAVGRRRRVERRLKEGKLRVVVTSTSLELGIDIGSVDAVVFVHPPGGVTRMLQRLGRSGHRPGQPRRGLFLTNHAADLLEAAVTAASARSMQIEPLRIPEQPLDVLCQHLAGMAMTGWHDPDDVYALARAAYPFRNLTPDDLQKCLEYLSGRHADGNNWLPPRLRWHEGKFSIVNVRATWLLRRNLGTIVDEEPCPIRLLHTDKKVVGTLRVPLPADGTRSVPATLCVGSLDEAYADGLQPGDRFVLDGRCFEYRRRENGEILVEEATSWPLVPHWSGFNWHVGRELAGRLFAFRQRAAEALRDGPQALAHLLWRDYRLRKAARAEIIRHFLMQEAVSEIPDSRTLLVECLGQDGGSEYFFHTPLHRPGNDALARLLAWRLAKQRGLQAEVVVADLGFMIALATRTPITPEAWRHLLATDNAEADWAEALGDCPSLRRRFGRAALTGLMVLRQPLGGRRKVGGRSWAERRLFDQVRWADPEFVLLQQARRELLAEACDTAAALQYMEEVPRRHVRCRWLSEVSPFAEGWTQPAALSDENVHGRGSDNVLAHVQAQLLRSNAG